MPLPTDSWRPAGVALLAGLLLLLAFPSRAQEPDGSINLHYAFAAQLGSGIYTVQGRTVQIYRFAAAIPLRTSESGDFRLKLKVPVTLGFVGFRIEDIIDTGLPQNVSTLAVIPTLEAGVAATDNWWLEPFAGIGGGNDFAGNELSLIYSAGAHSLAGWRWDALRLRLGNRLIYSGYTTESLSFVDDFAQLLTGLDLRRPLGFSIGGTEVDGSVFGVNYLNFLSPAVLRREPDRLEMRTQWELGLTLGTVEPWRILGIAMPRLGISYRFGSGPNAVRFVLGDPFPMRDPRDEGPAIL